MLEIEIKGNMQDDQKESLKKNKRNYVKANFIEMKLELIEFANISK